MKRGFGVVRERAAESGRVHEFQRLQQLERGQFLFDRCYLFLIVRIFVLADLKADFPEWKGSGAAIQETHRDLFGRPGAQPRDDRREWNDADGQHDATGHLAC